MIDVPVDRALLPRTFSSWFGRFSSLTPIQRQAIPSIMSGGDVLLCSATASGKTEAYAAPAAELALAGGAVSASVLIVTPTRALANDLKRRLEGPMDRVELPFGRYTGEHKERVGGQLPAVAVTTPEALDSLIARRAPSLAGVRMVVLDEVHVLDNTPRGDHMRVLLHRLDAVAARRPQRIAASATVDRPESLASRFLGPQHTVVVVPGMRGISLRAFDGCSLAAVAQHLDALAGHGFKKILVFCRSRNEVERYSAKLRGRTCFQDRVFAHHGSMAKIARERTERLFQAALAGVCFATLTLEMGIDIGTVDYVLLVSVPSDIPSLLQRIGRGSRRGGMTRAGFASDNPAEHHLHQIMFRLAKEGRLCGGPYGFRPSVIIQQILVRACAATWVEERDVLDMYPSGVEDLLPPATARMLLEAMEKAELLEHRGSGRYVPTEPVERRYEAGALHSNIDDEPGIEVVDRLTGDILGTVSGATSRRIEIAGSDREIVHSSGDRILTDSARGSEPATFRPRGKPSVSMPLARAVVESLGVGAGTLCVVSLRGTFLLVHGLGTAGAVLLRKGIEREFGTGIVVRVTPYTLTLSSDITELPELEEEECRTLLRGHLGVLASITQPGPWSDILPVDIHLEATARILGLHAIQQFLSAARLERLPDGDPGLQAVLADL